jgi:DNA sulfur modification protein DndB
MGMVVKLFQYDPEAMAKLRPEDRHQRALKKNRVPEIADYIVNNDDYIFSSITVSVDSDDLLFESSELDDNVGMLSLPMEAEWIVNDGQHRVAGIAEALKRDPDRKSDNLSVVILPDGGLERSQQVFSDLNRTVQKTSKSLDILFDHREPLNIITNACVERVRLFNGRTDKEKVSLSLRSADVATLSGLQAANAQLLPDLSVLDLSEADLRQLEDSTVAFWEYLTDLVEPWSDIASGRVRPADARAKYVSSYGLALWALGSVGQTASSSGGDWLPKLDRLKDVDWRKSNREWSGICMQGSEVVTRNPTRKATADLLRWKLGLGAQPHAVV